MSVVRVLLSAFLCLVWLSAAGAETIAKPQGKAILTISGNIANTNADGVAQFDRDMLEALGMETVETTTPWHDGRVRFEGVPLAKLMDVVGAKGSSITAVALNDYTSMIPMEDFRKFNVILAVKLDGKYMTVREKGPLFVIYPYDSDPELQKQTYYSRSAWQVARLIVE